MKMMLGVGCALLAACGQSDTTSKKADETNEPVVIEYWHVNADTQGGKTVKELVDYYNQSQQKVKVVAKYNPDMYKGLMQNLQAVAATDNVPDVVQVGWAFKDYFADNFEYTNPVDLDKEVEPEKAKFFEEKFSKNIMDLARKDHHYIGIPYSISNAVLYINQDLLKEAELDINGPKTWQDVQRFAKTIKEKTGEYGLYIQEPADSWATQALLESNGARVLTDGKASFASKEGIEAYTAYQKMVLQGEALHTSWDQGIQSFINGKVGMLYTTIAQRKNVQSNASFSLTTVQSPTWENKAVRLPAGGAMLAITSKGEAKRKATWDFIKYLYRVESVAKWTEGTGYLPPRYDVAEAENGLKKFLEENEMMKPAIKQLDKMVSWVSFPGGAGLEAEQKLLDMRDKILSGADVEQTMKQTQNDINVLLK